MHVVNFRAISVNGFGGLPHKVRRKSRIAEFIGG